MSRANKISFYAVAKGRRPGVYLSWEECEAQTVGFGGARYKKFLNAADAEAYVAQFNASTSSSSSTSTAANAPATSVTPVLPPVPPSPRKNKIYTRPEFTSGPASAHASTSNGSGRANLEQQKIQDETGWMVVYSDGACKGNGKAESFAGIGVWWGRDDPRNLAERCPGSQTNNRAELIAIVRALETAPQTKQPMVIKTDSQYSMNCLQSWMPKWLANGFFSSTGQPVKNEGVIRYISALLDQRALAGQKVTFQYVRGHVGEEGNEGADRLANVGATMPEAPERDWEALREHLEKQRPQRGTPLAAIPQAVLPSIDADADVVREPALQTVQKSPLQSAPMHDPRLAEAPPSNNTDVSMSREELDAYAACLLSPEELAEEMLWEE